MRDLIIVKARVKIFSVAEGGSRTTAIASGYRPNHVFEHKQKQVMSTYIGDLNFEGSSLVNPGEEREMLVRFLKVPVIEQYMQVGRRWQFYEGPANLIGEGEILEIVSGSSFQAQPNQL